MIYLLWIAMVVVVHRIGYGQGRIRGFNQYADEVNKEMARSGIGFRVGKLGEE